MKALLSLYADEGLRVLLAKGWFIYVVDESTDLVWVYNTKLWPEWLDESPVFSVSEMVPFAHLHQPMPVESFVNRRQMSLTEWASPIKPQRGAIA